MTADALASDLRLLYGDARLEEIAGRLQHTAEAWRPRLTRTRRARPDEREVVLIAYPDHVTRPGEVPLQTLSRFCAEHLRDAISTVHVLPFHPSTSYEGYAITDYLAVDPVHGTWDDVHALGEHFQLMFDWVLNHCSSRHPWFEQFRAGEEPGARYFLAPENPQAPWLTQVLRARNSPLLHPVQTARGERHVWTTYSDDLVDLNWQEPGLFFEMLNVLFDAVAHGARMIRLDAFVYVWKAAGTSCVDQPEGHALLRVFQRALAMAGAEDVLLLPSITNVSQTSNYRYFGHGERTADLIYHLPLSSLLLHALYANDTRLLQRWLAELPAAPPGRAYLNLTACHDGVGLSWLEGW